LQQTLGASAADTPVLALTALQSAGALIRSRGSFDFDQDGSEETWLSILPHPLDKLEFWILARYDNGVRGIFVATSDFVVAQPYWADAQAYPGVFQIVARQGYLLKRLPGSLEPYLVPVPVVPILTTYTLDALSAAEHDLLNGVEATAVRDDLLEVLASGRFNCKSDQICDRFTYLLGLAYELSGDSIQARDTYIQLWWENRQSPLTAAARLKLVYLLSLATATATRTPRTTPTRTPTSTPSLTPTP
jgi:hypothetical protein